MEQRAGCGRGDLTVLYLDCGGGYSNLHVIKLYGTKYTSTPTQVQLKWEILNKVIVLLQC